MKTRVEVVLDEAEVQLVKEYQTNNQCASFEEALSKCVVSFLKRCKDTRSFLARCKDTVAAS